MARKAKPIDELCGERKRTAIRKIAKDLGHSPTTFTPKKTGLYISYCKGCFLSMYFNPANNDYKGNMLTNPCPSPLVKQS